jgi:predicted amidohydrolase
MLLLDIEKNIRPLSRAEKIQLIRDIEMMLHEEKSPQDGDEFREFFQPGQRIGYHGPVDEPLIAAQLQELLSV